MMTVTSEYAAQHLDELLRAIAAGEEILITADGTPIARLTAVAAQDEGQDAEHVETPVEEVEQAFHGD